MDAIQTHEVGLMPLTVVVPGVPQSILPELVKETGRVFMLVGVDWDGDESVTLRFVPDNGVMEIQRYGD